MDSVTNYLIEWIIVYIKNRDIITKNLENIERINISVKVRYRDKEQTFIVYPFLTDFEEIIGRINNGNIALVTLNSKENLAKIVENWDKIKDFQYFSIYFVNPFSETDTKWIIHPYTHHKICDEDSLEIGLKSMFEAVEPVTEQTLKKIKK